MLLVSNDPSSAASVCVCVSAFFTRTVAPAFTVIESPNAKLSMVIVWVPLAVEVAAEGCDVGDELDDGLDFAFGVPFDIPLEPQPAAATSAADASARPINCRRIRLFRSDRVV